MDFHVVSGETDGWFHVDSNGTLATQPISMSWASDVGSPERVSAGTPAARDRLGRTEVR